MTYSANAVANAFIDLAKQEGKTLTNMKLQKLVYIAQGVSLAMLSEPLIDNNVHAFQWGPVIPVLYDSLKHYGSNSVTEKIPLGASEKTVDLNDKTSLATVIISYVWRKYGLYTAAQLSALTHKEGTPWSMVWNDNQRGLIPNDLIKYHYKELLRPVK